MTGKRHGTSSFDLRGISSREHRATVQGALNACDYPLHRIRRAAGVRVPVTIADTSRFAGDASQIHEAAEHAGASPVVATEGARAAALGLYWLPTQQHPAGRIEVGLNAIENVAMAQEVFLAEAAHAVDLTVLTDADRQRIEAIMHRGDTTAHGTHGWFEERGGQDYWAWAGEAFMSAFVQAFAPSLPRPLGDRQPWAHPVDADMARQVRELLLAPSKTV